MFATMSGLIFWIGGTCAERMQEMVTGRRADEYGLGLLRGTGSQRGTELLTYHSSDALGWVRDYAARAQAYGLPVISSKSVAASCRAVATASFSRNPVRVHCSCNSRQHRRSDSACKICCRHTRRE